MHTPSGTTRHVSHVPRGFTIIELLAVIVMIGLISTISMGQVHTLLLKERVQRASTALDNTIEAAFALATRNRQPVNMIWNSSANQFSITNRAGTAFRKVTIGSDTYGLTSGSVTFSNSSVTIYPNGLAGDTLLITIASTAETRYIHVSRAGLVRIQ